jgi:MFS family permease
MQALALPFGRLLDCGSHRRLNVVAGLLITPSLLGLSFTVHHDKVATSGRYYAVLLCAIPLGIGQSIYFLSSTHMARTWLPRRTGVALGVVNAGAALGGSLFPPLFTHLTADHSFALAMLTLAALAGFLSLFIIFFATPHPQNFRPAPSSSPHPNIHNHRRSASSTRSHLPHPELLLFTSAVCIIYLGVLSIPFYLPSWSLLLAPFSPSSPHPPKLSLVTVMNAAQLPGRVGASMLADVVSARELHVGVLMVAGGIGAGFWLGLGGVEWMGEEGRVLVAAYLFAAVYGVCHGGVVALIANGVMELLKGPSGDVEAEDRGTVDEAGVAAPENGVEETEHGTDGISGCGNYGQLSGTIYTIASPFMLAGPLVNGKLVDTLGVKAVGVWAAGCLGLGALLMSLSVAAGRLDGKASRKATSNGKLARSLQTC